MKSCAVIAVSNVQHKVYSCEREYYSLSQQGLWLLTIIKCNRSGTSVALDLGYMKTYQ